MEEKNDTEKYIIEDAKTNAKVIDDKILNERVEPFKQQMKNGEISFEEYTNIYNKLYLERYDEIENEQNNTDNNTDNKNTSNVSIQNESINNNNTSINNNNSSKSKNNIFLYIIITVLIVITSIIIGIVIAKKVLMPNNNASNNQDNNYVDNANTNNDADNNNNEKDNTNTNDKTDNNNNKVNNNTNTSNNKTNTTTNQNSNSNNIQNDNTNSNSSNTNNNQATNTTTEEMIYEEKKLIITRVGSVPEGYVYLGWNQNSYNIGIYGELMAVKKIDKIEASLDITGLTTSQIVEVPIAKPSGIKSMTFDKVNVEVKIEEKASKTFTNLSFNSARCDQVCYGVSGEPTTIDITVEGPKSTIDKLTDKDISRYCNAEGAGKGYVTGKVIIGNYVSQAGVTYTPSFTTCKLFVGR